MSVGGDRQGKLGCMSTSPARLPTAPAPAQPAWDVARLFPDQGTWSEQDYLQLQGNRLVEFSHGNIEVLRMPTEGHQGIVGFLYSMLVAFVRPRALGRVRFAPLRVRLWPGKIREPDVMLMLTQGLHRATNELWNGADLVMEVVSDDDRGRDLETKRLEYARAGIPEYWIVDPRDVEIIVLRIDGDHYVEHGRFRRGERASSALLPEFSIDVSSVFAAASE